MLHINKTYGVLQARASLSLACKQNPRTLNLTALPGIPLVQPGDDLAKPILEALARADVTLQSGDALVVTVGEEIVSKAEGRIFNLNEIMPGDEARQIAEETRKDPRIVELVLRESHAISRRAPGVLITRHRLGFVSASSEIDQSNVDGGEEHVLLLPLDPDASARTMRAALLMATGAEVGIVISNSHGRPFRLGNAGVAIGVAGMPALIDLRGQTDLFGRELKMSIQAYADEVASAANLLTGEAAEGLPVVLVRGLNFRRRTDTLRSTIAHSNKICFGRGWYELCMYSSPSPYLPLASLPSPTQAERGENCLSPLFRASGVEWIMRVEALAGIHETASLNSALRANAGGAGGGDAAAGGGDVGTFGT